jgi:vacuolar protein sorting-associated protein 13A/C
VRCCPRLPLRHTQVCLTFHPDGADWNEAEPVVVSDGFLGSTAGIDSASSQLPDAFHVAYSNSQSSSASQCLRISMQRHIDTQLLDSQRLRAAAARAAAAGGSSNAAAATAAVLKETSPDVWRMSYGAALAQGRTLTLSLSVPLWVVNGTQLPVAVGIVPLTAPAGGAGDAAATGLSGDASAGGSGGGYGGDAAGSGGGAVGSGVGQLRVINTEAFTSVTRPDEHVTIMGNSIELLSYPVEQPGGGRLPTVSDLGTPGAASGTVVMQWAAVFSIMGSRWSTPLVLTAAGGPAPGATTAGGASMPVAEAVARLPRFDPVLIRARCRDGCVYDVTVRMESVGSGLPMPTLVRLDPHMVVSNRTGYALHLLQPEPLWKALGGGGGSGSASYGEASWIMASTSGRSTNQGAWIAAGPAGAPGATGSGGSSGGSSSVRRPPSAAASSSSAMQDATVVLRPGALAVPLSWPQGANRRLLALALPPRSIGVSTDASTTAPSSSSGGGGNGVDPGGWSEPFRVCYPATGIMQVLLPLHQLGFAGHPVPVDAASMAAAYTTFRQLCRQGTAAQQQQQQQQEQGPSTVAGLGALVAGRPPKPPAKGLGSSSADASGGSSGSSSTVQQQASHEPLPMLVHVAKQTDAGLLEYLAVTVNVSVEMPAPGCLHVVLQSLGGEPQQCLMNCTRAAISYRQATPRSAWQLLPPLSAAALVLLQPPDVLSGLSGSAGDPLQLPSCPEVMLRDSDPATSGCAVCSLETDSSGVALPPSGSGSRRATAGRGSSASGGSSGGADQPATFAVGGGGSQALAQVLPLLEAVMGPAGPAEVPGAGPSSLGRTQLDRLLRVIPKPAAVSMNQLRLAANIACQDEVRPTVMHACATGGCAQVACCRQQHERACMHAWLVRQCPS